MEVLSPSSRLYDREIKRDAYLALGVAEYWLVDVDDRAIERFIPGSPPVRVTDRLVWRPLTLDRELVIQVGKLFTGV